MTKQGEVRRFFDNFVLPYKGDHCIVWPYARSRSGYGFMGYNGLNKMPHRLACELKHGMPPTPKHEAAHSCGNGHLGCVNPNHVSWKTPLANTADKVSHGTQLRGEKVPTSVLKPEDVEFIILMRGKATQTDLAARFGVKREAISKIQLGKRWAHISALPVSPIRTGRPPNSPRSGALK